MTTNSEYKIEDGIPLIETRGAPRNSYPFATMEPGQSFLVTGKTIDAVSIAAHRATSGLGRKFACRTVDGGIRVWRTA